MTFHPDRTLLLKHSEDGAKKHALTTSTKCDVRNIYLCLMMILSLEQHFCWEKLPIIDRHQSIWHLRVEPDELMPSRNLWHRHVWGAGSKRVIQLQLKHPWLLHVFMWLRSGLEVSLTWRNLWRDIEFAWKIATNTIKTFDLLSRRHISYYSIFLVWPLFFTL